MDHVPEVTKLEAHASRADDLQTAEQAAVESSEEQWARHASDVELNGERADRRVHAWQNPLNDF